MLNSIRARTTCVVTSWNGHLKACICKKMNQFDFYPKPQEYQKAWSHEIESLAAVSGREGAFKAARRAAHW